MVDLVKLRKKAKQKEGAAEESAAPANPAPEATPGAAAAAAPAEARAPEAPRELAAPAARPELPAASEPAAALVPATPAAPGKKHKPEAKAEAAPAKKEADPVMDEGLLAEALVSATTGGSSRLEQFKREAGLRREGIGLQGAAAEVTDGEVLELLTFAMGPETYAVAIENIVEIVTPRPTTRIPNADKTIVGIISLRGTIVTLLDVRRRLKHAASKRTDETRIIVIDRGSEMLGFEVDRVMRVVRIEAKKVEPHPVVHASELTEEVRGVFRQQNALTILLDLEKLLDSGVVAGKT